MIVRFYNIEWNYSCPDCSGFHNYRSTIHLPNEYVMEFGEEEEYHRLRRFAEPTRRCLAASRVDPWIDTLSDRFSWCVNKTDVEWVD